MMRKKNRGIALIYVTVALAASLAIFFRYGMNARARKAIAKDNYKLSDIEDSVKRAMSFGLNESYVIDQMIVQKKDFKLSGADTYFNLGNYKDYFLVKDLDYSNFYDGTVADVADKPIMIWEAGRSKTAHINNIWKKVKKINDKGKASERYPGYYVGGTNSFEFGTFGTNVRFSKGGYFIKAIQAVGNTSSYCGGATEKGIIYKVDYSEFSQSTTEKDNVCYIVGGSKTEGAESTLDPSIIDVIGDYLSTHSGGQKFIIDVRKDVAYEIGSGEIVAAFEGIAQFELTYPSTATDSKNPDIKILNYEINHIGP